MIKYFAESYFYISLPDQFFLLRDGLFRARKIIKEGSGFSTSFFFGSMSAVSQISFGEDRFSHKNISFGDIYEIAFLEENWSRVYEIEYEWLIEKVLLDLYHELDFCIGFSMTRYQKKMFFHWDRLVLYTTKRDLGLLSRLNRREIVSVPSWKRGPRINTHHMIHHMNTCQKLQHMRHFNAKLRSLWAIALALFLPAAPALAFVDPPTFSPAQPQAGQAIDMSVRAGVCHGFVTPPPGYPFVEVQTQGSIVDVIITGVEAYDPVFCNFPTGDITVDIDSLPQGDYTVRVRIRKTFPPFDILPPASQAPLRVSARATPVTVPASGPIGWISIAALLCLFAVHALRRKQHVIQ